MNDLGVQPSEFWGMKPRHFWWLYCAKLKKSGTANKPLTKQESKRLRKWMDRVNATKT